MYDSPLLPKKTDITFSTYYQHNTKCYMGATQCLTHCSACKYVIHPHRHTNELNIPWYKSNEDRNSNAQSELVSGDSCFPLPKQTQDIREPSNHQVFGVKFHPANKAMGVWSVLTYMYLFWRLLSVLLLWGLMALKECSTKSRTKCNGV